MRHGEIRNWAEVPSRQGYRRTHPWPDTGGLLILISGVIVCLVGLSTVVGGAMIEGMLGFDVDSRHVALGVSIMIVGALVSLAGKHEMQRRRWMWAVVPRIIIMLFGQTLPALGTAAPELIAASRPDSVD